MMEYGIICLMATYDIIARAYVTDEKKKSWLLSLPMTGLIGTLGLVHASYWFLTGDNTESQFTIMTTRTLKNYMLVELGCELIFNLRDIAILETVIHHVAYYFFFDHVVVLGFTGFMRPFYVFELSTFMRALSYVFPQYHNELAVGISFGIFRIAWPLYAIAVLPVPAWYYYVAFICVMIAHTYWMVQWFNKKN